MSHLQACFVLFAVFSFSAQVHADIEYNTINDDGSFQFRHTNDDIGGYYHSASGSPDNIVRGRYGSRNPATGQVEETVYTAGPRGFRVNGPKIHRKMDLAQFPVLPRGSPDDPLADPYDDPTYSFNYRAADHSRSEDSDATGRIRGLYSYIDDVGERHSVRYAAGAGTGFEVSNAVPDNPASVGYANPLYKAHPSTRGKMTVQRGPAGSYKLIAAGPDHRRAESRGTDGLVRGTYSYLDDKGVQRTVEYIAGAGIGYRVVKNRVGPGTHINPSVADFRLSDTDFRLANEYGRGAGVTLNGGSDSSGGAGGRGGGAAATNGIRSRPGASGGGGGVAGRRGGTGSRGGTGPSGSGADKIGSDGGSGGGEYLKAEGTSEGGVVGLENEEGVEDNSLATNGKADRMGTAGSRRGGTRFGGGSRGGGGGGIDEGETYSETGGSRSGGSGGRTQAGSNGGRTQGRNGQRQRGRPTSKNNGSGSSGSSTSGTAGGRGYLYDPPSASADNYNLNDDDAYGSLPPLVTANQRILEIDRERDWVQRHRDSTVIKNVGKWYLGLPPGQSVRAHVQNIDLVPLGGRVVSPSEALRQDEIAELAASIER